MYACVHVLIYADIHRGQKRMLDPLELELQVSVSCLTWMLVTELGPSANAAKTPNHLAISPSVYIIYIHIYIIYLFETCFYLCVHLCMCMPPMCKYPWRPEESAVSPGAEVTSSVSH